jgi:purine-nucleoside phosphorylase
VKALSNAAQAHGVPHHVGTVVTTDCFYNPCAHYRERYRACGALAVEMESSVLFFLAARSAAAGTVRLVLQQAASIAGL